MGFDLGSIAKGAVSGLATPLADAWARTKESQAAIHTIDKQTDRDVTIASFTADVQFAQAQRLLNEADRTHWSTRWMRPAFGALAFLWVGAELVIWLGLLKRPPVEIDPIVKFLLAGIVGSLFLLRPFEKNKRVDIAATALRPAKPAVLSKITTRRADDQ